MGTLKFGKVGKLIPNHKEKKTYLVHIKNLNQALKHGLKLTKAHRVIRFMESYEALYEAEYHAKNGCKE